MRCICKCLFFYPLREAVSNFLTALSLQRKSRNQQQVPHPAISGNIWAALRIALSLMDQPELFQAANLGDLDVLLRAFNLDPWKKRKNNNPCPYVYSEMQTYFIMNSKMVTPDVQKAMVIEPEGIPTDNAQSLFRSQSTKCYIESRSGSKEEARGSRLTKIK